MVSAFGRKIRRSALGSIVWLLAAISARAVAPNLASVSPTGGQRGTTVEVTLSGARLADAQEVFFYTPGITVEKLTGPADKQVRATFKIAPDCPLGEHALRLRTASGISALRIFFVGLFPSVEEKEPNNEIGQAQPVALNSTVQGTVSNEDVDFFSVEAKQGQRLSAEIEGARLGRTMFDPCLTIQQADGHELTRSDDTPLLGHDGFVSLIAPADGKYFIQVRDVAFSGSGHFYRLHVGDFPRPAVAVPLGGKAGETLDEHFLGDPAGEFSAQIKLPAEPAGKFGVLAEHNGVAPSPNWIRVTELPNAEATKPGNTPATAPLVNLSPPFAFNGVLEAAGEAAFFRFKAKKDQNLDFQVYARRLGSPLDSVLTLLDAKGKSLGSNDDAAGHPDSALRQRIPENGEYTVKIADQLKRGGPLFAFRVEIDEVRPTLTLSIPDTARYDNETRKSIVVPRGNRFAILLNINRDACNDDLGVAFDGLPAGIAMHADTVPGSVSQVPVVFEAEADAPIAGTLLTPVAKPTDASKAKNVASRFRHNVEWVRIENDTVYVQSEVDRIAAAVAEEAPFKINLVEPKVPLVQSGELALKIVAERKEGFDEPITLKMVWNPPGVNSPPEVVIPKGATTANYKLNATNKADARPWKIALVAGANVKGGTAFVSSQLARLEVAPAFLIGKIDLTKIVRGQPAKLVCALEQKQPFDGVATAHLVGLPDNVTAKDVEITKDSKEAVFEIATNDKSPTGTFKNVFCTVTITQASEPITQHLARGSVVRIDAPKTKPAAAPALAKTNE